MSQIMWGDDYEIKALVEAMEKFRKELIASGDKERAIQFLKNAEKCNWKEESKIDKSKRPNGMIETEGFKRNLREDV